MDGLNTVVDYINALQSHDWYYMYSDDNSVYMSGSKASNKIAELQRAIDPDFGIWNSIAPADCRVKAA